MYATSRDAGDADLDACFASSYTEARVKFRAACAARGLDVAAHGVPGARGIEGEELAIDVAVQGAPAAERLLVISSACHGVEGYCGSGVQVRLLRDPVWNAEVERAGVAVLYLHALNPYGFSWARRTTQDHVDLNRNYVDFTRPVPANPDYDALAPLLVPHDWPPAWRNAWVLRWRALTMGRARLQRAISGGQYSDPHGLFYGGSELTWNVRTVREVLRRHGAGRRRLAWIDLHTGLGPAGVGERIHIGRDDALELARARAWWGQGVTSLYDGSSVSARLTGQIWLAVYDDCPEVEYTGIAIEFGTVPIKQVLHALRGDQWLALHPDAPAPVRQDIRRAMREAFYIDTPAWRRAVVTQAEDAAREAVQGLCSAE